MERSYKSNIIKIYIFSFILGIHTVRAVYIPFMMDWGGLSFFQIMILQSYFTAMIVILEIPSGAIADFLGRKPALALSAFSVACAALTYSIIPHFFLFMLAETLWAFGAALMSGTSDAFVYFSLKSSGEEKNLSTILGRSRTVNLIALTISAPIGSIIAHFISLPFTMTSLAFIYIGAFVVALTFKEPKFANNNYKQESYWKIIISGFKELKKNKVLRILALDWIPINTLIFFLFWTYQVYLTAINIPIFIFGFILLVMNIVNALFSMIIPFLLKKSSNKKLFLILINLINGVAYISLGLTNIFPLGIAIILTIVAFGYTRYFIFVDGVNLQIESENRATVLSTINMFGSLIRAIIYPFVGLLVEWSVFAVFIIIGVLILILTIFTRSKSEYL
ncbi:MAG: MFS transporter [Candidatus Lokiarchaeota archaeon]|nr:MFS transporter [Candidatus Lokiarchaeota archaeon]